MRPQKHLKPVKKYILYHEVAHTFGRYLMDKKILDYHYTDYQEYVKLDKNYVPMNLIATDENENNFHGFIYFYLCCYQKFHIEKM